MKFNHIYNRDSFEKLLSGTLFGEKYKKNYKSLNIDRKTILFDQQNCFLLGKINLDKDIYVFEIKQKSKNDPRITLTKDAFKIMEDIGANFAIIIFYSDDSKSYRLSLLTRKKIWLEKEESNPKRYSFLLGEGEKVKTPEKQLNKQINTYKELFDAFDVEVVRKEFFNNYLDLYIRLYREIINEKEFTNLLKGQGVDLVSFTKTLLGKIVFIYFIQKKGWLGVKKGCTYGVDGDKDFMRTIWDDFKNNEESLTIEKKGYFYNDYLEWLFYEGFNKDRRDNDDSFVNLQMKVPYLNGGLFKEDYKDRERYVVKISNDIFSNENKTGILDIFDTYNFTIDEDDLYDKEIAVDPEMLGKIFEKMISISSNNIDDILIEYNKNEGSGKKKKIEIDNVLNKKLGAFYTPREIVHYMTKESLIAYLINNLKGKKEDNDKKVRALFELKEQFLLTKEDLKFINIDDELFDEVSLIVTEVDSLLKSVKIIDPAVGSGAFPMGILHEISTLRYYIYGVFYKVFGVEHNFCKLCNDGKRKVSMYKIKKDIIQNNIYGVDIEPGAIDIARLRFWLSLIVDEDIEETNSPDPLPNFEFKFICANSLIPLSNEKGIYDNIDEEKLRDKVNKWYNAQSNKGNNNEEGKEKLEKSIKEILQKGHSNLFASEKEKQLISFNPFENKTNAEFFDYNLMFGIRRGEKFDIVIGNPPYIQLQKDGGFLGKMYEKKGYETFEKTGDIYSLFYEYSIKILKQGGVSTMITSNKWMRAGYGEKLRQYFVDNTNPLVLIDLGAGVFETATVDSNILILEKKQVKEFNLLGINLSKETQINDLYKFYNKKVIISDLSNENWNIITEQEQKIKDKIEENGTPLGKWDISIKFGIKTGLDEAFIIDEETKNQLISLDIKNSEIIKETIRGKIIYKYSIEKSGRYLINSHNGLSSKGILKINIDDYTSIKEHLEKFEPKLSKRYDKGDTQYNLRNCAYLDDFLKEKIIFSRIVKSPQFYYDDKGLFAEATSYIITGESLKYLLAFLNSNIVYKIFYKFYAGGGIDGEIKIAKFVNLPIPKISTESQKPFIEKVDKILEITKQAFYDPKNPPKEQLDIENEIDKMVYVLYGLSDEEIRVVEKV